MEWPVLQELPVDYAISKNLKVGYAMGDEVKETFQTLVKKAKEKGIEEI